MPKGKNRISQVVTRGGDRGETSLADGSRVAKTEPRIHALGAVDELNSFVGLLAAELKDTSAAGTYGGLLERLQQELFDIGAHLATVGATPAPASEWIDAAVEELNASLPPLTEFVLPTGERDTVLCHVCRTVCRRAERHCWETSDADDVARYLNRLSDLLFVMARVQKRAAGADESQWRGIDR